MTTPAASKPGPAWPLFTVAALSFLPILGIFFAGAGATWGLVSSRHRAMWAALLAMTGGLLNIAGIMVLGIAGFNKSGGFSKAGAELAQADLHKLVIEIEAYHAKENRYPASLHVLREGRGALQLVGVMDQSAGPFHLREYTYLLATDGESYDLFAVGPDNVPGTADDIRPVLSDSLRLHSGFRPHPSGELP